MHDSSRNPNFNHKLLALIEKRPFWLADLGCAGGGFVSDMLEAGQVAIGLEGSDYNLQWDGPGGTEQERATRKPGKRAEWANIPDNLFTCDVTRPFQISVVGSWCEDCTDFHNEPAIFDVITAWEIMEHLPEERLPTLCENITNHLADDGLWIMSVSVQVGMYHQTVRPRHWWLEFFGRHGFKHHPDLVSYFGDDWIRGPNQKAPESFHLILRKVK